MNSYKFKLQKLLDIRLDKEEECKRNFKDAQREKFKIEEKLTNLKKNYNKYRNIVECTSVVEQKIRLTYLNTINFNINDALDQLKIKERIVEDKRKDLMEKQLERKTVEILKEKDKQAFVKEQNLIEQRMNDEFALYGFIRNLKGGD